MKDFSLLSTLPSSQYIKELSKLLESGKYRLALLRLPENGSVSDIESFQVDSTTDRITSANFKSPATEAESFHLEIASSINYSLLAQNCEDDVSFKTINKTIEGWNVVKSLKVSGELSGSYDLACEDTSGIPVFPIVPQPSLVAGKLNFAASETSFQKDIEGEPVKKKKRKAEK